MKEEDQTEGLGDEEGVSNAAGRERPDGEQPWEVSVLDDDDD